MNFSVIRIYYQEKVDFHINFAGVFIFTHLLTLN